MSERRERLVVGTSISGDRSVTTGTWFDFEERFDVQVRPQAGATARGSFAAVAVASVYTPPG